MKMRGLFVGVLAVALTFGLSFGVMAEEGVTDTEIHVGQWGPQTGPAAPWGAVARGTDAYFKMINAEGGIHGRKLILHYFDDALQSCQDKGRGEAASGGDRDVRLGVGRRNGMRPFSKRLPDGKKDSLGRSFCRFTSLGRSAKQIPVQRLSHVPG